MKFSLLLLTVCLNLAAFTIPYTTQEIKTEQNEYTKFYGSDTDDSLKCPLNTRVWLWHDGENLFVLWEAEIDSTFTPSKFSARDNFLSGDNLRFQVITDVNKYYAYVYYAYSSGVRTDGIRATDLNITPDWNSKYSYKNEISGNLWKCLMTIPFKDLRFNGEPPYDWKIVLTRYQDKTEKTYASPFLRTTWGKDYFRKAIDIEIKEKIAENNNLLLRPYFVKKYDMMNKEESFDPDNVGLDFAYNPNFATKIKVSLNPDFSDVPLDAEQSNFNRKYAPWYDENRYFFTEDLNVFGGGSFLFYTRRIAQPKYAVKITGNTDNCSYGFLSTMSEETDNYNRLMGEDVYDNALAYKPTWDDLTVNFSLYSRSRKDYHNEVLHINPSYNINRDHSIWVDANLTYKDSTDYQAKKGYNYSGGYGGKIGDWGWDTSGGIVSKDFVADIGRYEERNFYFDNWNMWFSKDVFGDKIKSYGYSYWGSFSRYNNSDSLRMMNNGVNLWTNTAVDINGNINGNLNKENYEGVIYDMYNCSSNISFEFWKAFKWNFGGETGTTIIYDYAEKHRYNTLWGGIWGDIGSHVTYNASVNFYSYEKMPEDGWLDNQFMIGNAGTTINFNNDVSLSGGLRYRDDHSYGMVNRIGFFSNFRWEFKPDCNLFAGYSTAGYKEGSSYERGYEQSYFKVNYSF